MTKYLYRLWFSMVGTHGSDFNKFCEKCQDKIEEELEDGFVLPTKVGIDTSIGIQIKFGWKWRNFEPCKECQDKLRKFLESTDFLKLGNPNDHIELWRNKKEAV